MMTGVTYRLYLAMLGGTYRLYLMMTGATYRLYLVMTGRTCQFIWWWRMELTDFSWCVREEGCCVVKRWVIAEAGRTATSSKSIAYCFCLWNGEKSTDIIKWLPKKIVFRIKSQIQYIKKCLFFFFFASLWIWRSYPQIWICQSLFYCSYSILKIWS